ncbi:unnamed protein product [Effrenium voratum]|uniref:Mitotic checkpoint protein n=1 Tax=Effrenium voratum TaxID=2562239 RepID=A0AA36ILV4_9DINO|nr:unnamed protein product [Effrenium voratum]
MAAVEQQYLSSSGDVLLRPAEVPGADISCLAWSPVQNLLAAGAWDKTVSLWEVLPAEAVARARYSLEAPVLCCSFSDGQHLISGGCDHKVTVRDLQAQQSMELGRHSAPVRYVSNLEEHQLVVSGSWDKTVCFWSPQQQQPVFTLQLPERVFAMDVKFPLMVVGCADRQVLTFDLSHLRSELAPTSSTFSGLKMQTRSVCCFPDKSGFALGGIEGRCWVKNLEDSSKSFTFKCHQFPDSARAVNALDVHAAHPSLLATAGGDGSFIFWQKADRKLLKRFEPSKVSLTAGKFNSSGYLFAYAVSYDWSKGHEAFREDAPRQVGIHQCRLEELAYVT